MPKLSNLKDILYVLVMIVTFFGINALGALLFLKMGGFDFSLQSFLIVSVMGLFFSAVDRRARAASSWLAKKVYIKLTKETNEE